MQVADDVGGKAALRAEGELIERENFAASSIRRLRSSTLLQFRHLGADEPEHHHLALGHEAQRLEAAGARRVVFEQEAIVRQFVEQPLGDGVVAAFAVPHAALVAAAEMNAGRNASPRSLHHLRLRPERAREIRLGSSPRARICASEGGST